ncbi:MAG: cadherin repeat domain-containing protein, partial [Paracoccaceae bacterium]
MTGQIIVSEGSNAVIDLDCGTSNPDIGTDICVVRDGDVNGFGEDTEKPTEITLTLGDELTTETISTQGNKLEVGDIVAADNGNGQFFIRVSDNDDPDDTDDVYFSGDVGAGESFTAVANDGKFGSETFVHIFDDDGTYLQTINFHTSCSAPLVIGDQYGSVSLTGAAVEGKDSGTLYQIGSSAAVGDDGVTYEILGGADAALFTVDAATGEVSFIDPPDFENPQDSGGDNTYEVTVRATREDGTFEDKPLEVCVEDDCIKVQENTTFVVDLDCGTSNPDVGKDICVEIDRLKDEEGVELEKPTELTLTLGDVLDTTPSGFQSDEKSSVSELFGTEDGDGQLRVLVTDDDDPSNLNTVYFAGDLSFGDSFTALAANAGEDKFSSNTYVHILDDDGTLLQTIQIHTSCSAPIVIGDQFGTVTLQGVGLPDKDTGEVTRFGSSDSFGDDGVTYEILGGADAALFTVDAATGEVSFIDAPDFEDPQDTGGDNTYEVTVRATREDGTFQDKPLEICVEDDAICVKECVQLVIDLDCGTSNPDLGLEICTERDRLKDEEDIELEKPTELTLTLGDVLDTTPLSVQPDDKSSVSELFGTEDGDGQLRVLVTDDDAPSKLDTVYFEGDLSFGDSFTALAANAGEDKFSSNTYVHILDDDGSLL